MQIIGGPNELFSSIAEPLIDWEKSFFSNDSAKVFMNHV